VDVVNTGKRGRMGGVKATAKKRCRQEVKSRIDFRLMHANGVSTFVEVKSVTLAEPCAPLSHNAPPMMTMTRLGSIVFSNTSALVCSGQRQEGCAISRHCAPSARAFGIPVV
jgi:hypothetical protein